MSISGSFTPPWDPNNGRRTMAFVDGTNLIAEMKNKQIKLPSVHALGAWAVEPKLLVRVLVYTTEAKANAAKTLFGDEFFKDCRLVYGDTIETGSDVREKGVDAQLVADLVYNAAQKNADHLILISNDSDFAFALMRAEDFGCTTEVRWGGGNVNSRLINAADSVFSFTKEELQVGFNATELVLPSQ